MPLLNTHKSSSVTWNVPINSVVAEITTPVCEGLIPVVIRGNLRQRAVRCTASQQDIERACSELGDSRRLCPRHQPIPSYGWCPSLY